MISSVFVRPGILNIQALKQLFLGGERGQRQCGSGIPAKVCRFVSDNTRINQLVRGITARTGTSPAYHTSSPGLKPVTLVPTALTTPAGIPAENACGACRPFLTRLACTLVSTG